MWDYLEVHAELKVMLTHSTYNASSLCSFVATQLAVLHLWQLRT